ncbi:apoptosis-inducing factor 1, mitochondrial-like [Watersipora subatra]|uniref:apoptosis-inducing factor 1, mitochondrial-like n=1 Tax=Watersipora subatra TaxID=2589382 RepID=UPI00355B83F0
MIRSCSTRIPRAVHLVTNGKSGCSVIAPLGFDGNRQRSQYGSTAHHGGDITSYWCSLGVGLVIGATGLAYMIKRDRNVAQCGSSDNWKSKTMPPTVSTERTTSSESETDESLEDVAESEVEEEVTAQFPTHVPYLIIGAGTAAMAAYRAIRAKHSDAKVLLVGAEEYKPYMRPPLSKDMWFTERSLAEENKFTTWSGRQRSIFYEKDSYYCQPSELSTSGRGGVAVATGMKVVKLDADKKRVTLSDGTEVSYDRCLIATGGKPKNLPCLEKAGSQVMDKVTLFRGIDDFRKLDKLMETTKSVIVIGGGFLGSELACALGKRSTESGLNVTQVFPESGNMGRVLPAYLSKWTTDKVRSEHVTVKAGVTVKQGQLSDDGTEVELLLSDGSELSAEHILVAVGLEPNTELAESAGLEVHKKLGGFLVNAELEAATDIWVAGDAACFYDVKLGRRRVEHHDHAVVSGRLAGENMAGAARRFLHQSMFWSDLGPDVGYEAIGLVDSQLPTVSIFAKATSADSPVAVESKTGESLRSETEQNQMSSVAVKTASQSNDYAKGVIFYMKGKRVVGVVCWNVFNKIGIARKIIKDGAEHEDLSELAKLFDLHASSADSAST